jgi:diacylglycerol kinase family enzyme
LRRRSCIIAFHVHVLLIHNPAAGKADGDANELISQIRGAGHLVDHPASKADWPAGLAKNPDVVAVVGGDGTVAEVARFLHKPVPLALLPIGTANNIATSLGLANVPLPNLIAGWSTAARRPFDVGIARGPWGTFRFLESIGAGLLSESISHIDEGWASHINAIDDAEHRMASAVEVFRETLMSLAPAHFALDLDGHDVSGNYVMVEAMNFGAAGPNLQLSRFADYSDGLIDLVVVDVRSRERLHRELGLFRSDPDLASTLTVHRGRHLRLEGPARTFHLDDQLWTSDGHTVSIEVSIDRAALLFLVPSPA